MKLNNFKIDTRTDCYNESVCKQVSSAFTYDDRYQLIQEAASEAFPYGFNYTYDNARNRTKKQAIGTIYPLEDYNYISANILNDLQVTIDGVDKNNDYEYYYDDAGNLTKKN